MSPCMSLSILQSAEPSFSTWAIKLADGHTTTALGDEKMIELGTTMPTDTSAVDPNSPTHDPNDENPTQGSPGDLDQPIGSGMQPTHSGEEGFSPREPAEKPEVPQEGKENRSKNQQVLSTY